MCVDGVADQVEISARVFLLFICILFEGYPCSICHYHSDKVRLGCLRVEVQSTLLTKCTTSMIPPIW